MNFFYRWCARVAKNRQDAIAAEIENHTKELKQAVYFDNLCYKAQEVAARWRGVNEPFATKYSHKDIETLVHFVDFKVGGARVNWNEIAKTHKEWFIERGLEIPKID